MSAGGRVEEASVVAPRLAVLVPLVLAMLSMIGPFSIDTPFPAFPEIRDEFGVGTGRLQLIVTAYMLAFAAMSIFHGPLSDSIGRRPVILGSVGVYAAASIACTFAPTFELLLAGRVLQGLSAGGATIVSRTVIRDMFEGEQAQRLMSRVALIFGLAPAVAPVVGGGLLQVGPWQLVFAFQVVLGVVLIVATLVVLPETHPVAATLVVLPETHPVAARVPLRLGEIARGLSAVVRQPAFHRLAWAGTLGFGAQFLYIGGAAIFVVDLLGLGELDFWVLFVPMIGSMMVGSWISGRSAGLVTQRSLVSVGYCLTLLGGVVGVGLAASPLSTDLPWAVVGPSLIGLGNGMAFPSIQLMTLDLLPTRRGAVMSCLTFLTLIFNAVAAVALTPYVATSTLGLALTALVVTGLGSLSWAWHCAATRPVPDPAADPATVPTTGPGGA
ncbi:multidrug effflux MFS transporter [Nocardioides currus]|uniref:Bcr/CflA family drug resistance efflux transporter n=1 Tax=Nocardioides currus TaxID=2133958 RepID=A0A2R7Z1W2_9ACTN|nr:multidrug effflux MFS transporter [Nocardioides currus]PUA82610.1 Bcr/CflA family drug resistance efflux transporter [Nocardioides currus]